MIRIYVIRHGETESNTRFACVGSTDVPLNEVGIEQAQSLCRRIDGVCADIVYVSPLSRAFETIRYYCDNHVDIPVVTEPAIAERDFGDWEDMSFEEIQSSAPEMYRSWENDFIGYKVPGGESSVEVQERVNGFIDKLISQGDDKTYFVVTHLGTSRHIISRCLGLRIEESWRFTLNNASMAVIDIDGGTGVLKYLNV